MCLSSAAWCYLSALSHHLNFCVGVSCAQLLITYAGLWHNQCVFMSYSRTDAQQSVVYYMYVQNRMDLG